MRDRSYDTEFESYLEKQANRHKMYPPDFIWRNIQEQLHGYKKWPALTVIALFCNFCPRDRDSAQQSKNHSACG